MNFIPKDRILKFKPDTLEFIRKQYNLEKPGEMKEAVKILHDWVQKQSHFKKKDFDEHYYEMCIIGSKGSIEHAKAQIDRMCTMRTLLPKFFESYNYNTDIDRIKDIGYTLMLPKITDDHYRVDIIKYHDVVVKPSLHMEYYRSTVVLADYLKVHDYTNGFIIITDLSETNIMGNISKLNLIDLRQLISVFFKGYGFRVKSIHVLTSSKFIDQIMWIVKQIVSPKVLGRIHIHKTIEDVYEYVPKSILPKDYGGEERSLKELQKEWIEALSSEEHVKYMREINEAITDESCRPRDKFNEQYAGMPGTFRLLSVD